MSQQDWIAFMRDLLPARMNGSHWWARYVRVTLHGHGSFSMILTDILVHLVY